MKLQLYIKTRDGVPAEVEQAARLALCAAWDDLQAELLDAAFDLVSNATAGGLTMDDLQGVIRHDLGEDAG